MLYRVFVYLNIWHYITLGCYINVCCHQGRKFFVYFYLIFKETAAVLCRAYLEDTCTL